MVFETNAKGVVLKTVPFYVTEEQDIAITWQYKQLKGLRHEFILKEYIFYTFLKFS